MANRFHLFVKRFSTQLYISWVLFIALITLLPGYSIPGNIDWNFLEMDKIIHMIVFAILTYLGCHYFAEKGKKVGSAMIVSLLPALFYGTAIEFLQMFIPQRGFDFADLSADAIGAILGVFAFRFMYHRISEANK